MSQHRFVITGAIQGFWLGVLMLVFGLSSCGGSSGPALASQVPSTGSYVRLVHDYWMHYLAAVGDMGAAVCLKQVDPPRCSEIGLAMVAVDQKFLSDLDRTPAPPQFVDEDSTLRRQLPTAITHLKAMIVAAKSGNKQEVLDAGNAYVDDMMPAVTDALDRIDPSVKHV